MRSIRFKLTAWYTVAMTATLVVFAAAVYWERREAALQEQDERLDAVLLFEADFAVRWLQESAKSLGTVVTPGVDSGYVLNNEVGSYLEGMRDHLTVIDNDGRQIFVSERTRELGYAGATKMRELLQRRPLENRRGLIRITQDDPPFRYHIRRVDGAGPQVTGLLVAAQPDQILYGPNELLRSMAIVAPLILFASALLGSWLASNALQPVDAMIDEIEAIQDGRSLHRRLAAVPGRGDELGRLAVTVNAMLSRVETSFTALRRFTADASHELKTPLMVLRAGVERALTHPQAPPDTVASLDETLRQISVMGELVTNLLTLARADEGRSSLALADTDIRALLAEIGETAEMLGEEQGIAVSLELPPDPVVIAVDAPRIRQLLMNLVTNAVKYTSEGSVTMALDAREHDVVLVVRDTGIGIAPGDVPNIFDRFWRADLARSRTGDRPGTGLGLAISKWIVEAHGGAIGVQSRPGRGTTFTVVLPRGQAPESALSHR